MSRESVEIVRHLYECTFGGEEVFSASDLDRYISEFFAPEIEWRTSAEDPDAGIHHGRQAFKRYLEHWMESFEGLRADVEEYIEVGDDCVLLWVRWSGRGQASGVEADWHLAIIYTVREGRIVRGEEYFDRAEALEAAGLRE